MLHGNVKINRINKCATIQEGDKFKSKVAKRVATGRDTEDAESRWRLKLYIKEII
jgi:hypothetical protein